MAVDIDKLREQYIVIEADGVGDLEKLESDLRVLDNELETGVQALYDADQESIVAFLFAKGQFDEEDARAWVEAAEENGVNLSLSVKAAKKQSGPARPTFTLPGTRVEAAVEDMSYQDIIDILRAALEGQGDEPGLEDPKGAYIWPWLKAVFDDYCIVYIDPLYYKVTYSIDDENQVTFGDPEQVRVEYVPVVSADAHAGHPSVFSLHLRDPGKDLPADLADPDDGLIWKEIFQVSTTFRPITGDALIIEQDMIDAMDASFGKALDQVPITASTHHVETDGIVPASETVGFVARMVKVGERLFGGLKIMVEDVLEKLESGLIKDVSVYVWGDFHDRSTGQVWDWVLVHLLLTNYPQLPGLGEFGTGPDAIAASLDGAKFKPYMEENIMPEGQTQVQTQISKEDLALLEEFKTLKAQGFSAEAFQALKDQKAVLTAKAREMEIKSIIAALEGKDKREDVTALEGYRHYPAIVAAVEKALQADHQSFGADIGEDGVSPLDAVILEIVNALPAEARLKLEAEPARPDRGTSQETQQRPTTTRTKPIKDGSQVSDEQIEQLASDLGRPKRGS